MFQPACIEIEDESHAVLIRDCSEMGAGFEGDLDLMLGQPLRYRWGNEDFYNAKVTWIKGHRFGVEDLRGKYEFAERKPFNYRSVRIPTSRPVDIFIRGIRESAELINVSQRGFCVLLQERPEPGTLATLKSGRNAIEAATLKWSNRNQFGFTTPNPLRIDQMSALLAG
ncbi:hypothetical protein [Parapontixanthobacter aurantiacus]|nr:hypothetical protein [Parapontixanthobacter aurantiacus]